VVVCVLLYRFAHADLTGPKLKRTITVYDISAYNSAIYIGVMEYRTCERSGELSGRVRKNDGTGAEQGARASWNGNYVVGERTKLAAQISLNADKK